MTMKTLTAIFTITLFSGLFVGTAAADTPPLDRPTPPPCCADGVCDAHAGTYGWFQTRWRPWAGESVNPGAVPTAPAAGGLPPYVRPTPENEDLRAPPATKSATPLTGPGPGGGATTEGTP